MSIAELDPLDPATDKQMANAVVGLDRLRPAMDAGLRRDAHASMRASACAPAPASSRAISPTRRYLGQGWYRYDLGGITCRRAAWPAASPDTRRSSSASRWATRRRCAGWDKYDIAPVGGDRVVYSSVEYRYTGLALFLDVGSVWDANTERRVRVSTGFGFHAGPAFLVVGFPLNTDDLTRGVHHGSCGMTGVGLRW